MRPMIRPSWCASLEAIVKEVDGLDVKSLFSHNFKWQLNLRAELCSKA